MAMNVGQAEVAALIPVGQTFVIDAEHVQDGGVEVVNMDPVFRDVVAVIVRGSMGIPGLSPATGHPNRVATGVMVPPEIVGVELSLAIIRPPEFPAPNDQGILKHAPLLKIGNKGGGGLVGLLALSLDAAGQTTVLIPTFVIKLNESHPFFGQPSCK